MEFPQQNAFSASFRHSSSLTIRTFPVLPPHASGEPPPSEALTPEKAIGFSPTSNPGFPPGSPGFFPDSRPTPPVGFGLYDFGVKGHSRAVGSTFTPHGTRRDVRGINESEASLHF